MVPAILGIAPETSFPKVTALEVWDRLVNGTEDRLAEVKTVARAVERGLSDLLPRADAHSVNVVRVALWHSTDAWAADGPPPWWYAVVQYSIAKASRDRANVGLLISGGAWRAGSMGRDQTFIDTMLEAINAFVERVEKRHPPEISGVIDSEIVRRLWPTDDAAPRVDLPGVAVAQWDRLKFLRAEMKPYATEEKLLETSLRAAMRGSVEGWLADGRRLALRPWGGGGRRLVEV